MIVAERVAAARKRLGWSQAELARRAAITPGGVSQIEGGSRIPSADTLLRLAEALGLSTDWLLGRVSAEQPLEPRVAAMIRGWEKLRVRDREAILGLYETLAEPEGER